LTKLKKQDILKIIARLLVLQLQSGNNFFTKRRYSKMKQCTNCGHEAYRTESRFCLKCGQALSAQDSVPHQNICTNPECDWHKTKFIYPDDARFCDACGSPTFYGK
jgi:rRNA maturation endonuclease Nob1